MGRALLHTGRLRLRRLRLRAATLATFFVGRDAANAEAEVAGAEQIERLQWEIAALREELRAFMQREK